MKKHVKTTYKARPSIKKQCLTALKNSITGWGNTTELSIEEFICLRDRKTRPKYIEKNARDNRFRILGYLCKAY